jgi:hypothetical protein
MSYADMMLLLFRALPVPTGTRGIYSVQLLGNEVGGRWGCLLDRVHEFSRSDIFCSTLVFAENALEDRLDCLGNLFRRVACHLARLRNHLIIDALLCPAHVDK